MTKKNNGVGATPGKVWRSGADGIVLEMPSSTPEAPRFAKIRSVDMGLLIRLGRIPDSLTSLIAEGVQRGGNIQIDTESMDGVKKMIELAEAVCEVAFVSPKIVVDPLADDEISLDHLTLEDKLFVLSFFQKPTHVLESFRLEQTRHVEPVLPEQADLDPAPPDAAPERVGVE